MGAEAHSQPTPDTAPPARLPTGRETALIAIGQGALMVLGGVLALLVAQVFGKNSKTDAFFAAYGLYAVGLTFGQTFRLTAVSRVLHSHERDPVSRLVGAVAVMALAVAIPMVALAGPLGGILVGKDPTHVAPGVLRILWIALAGQLLAALLATVLAVRGAFSTIGLATLASGFVSIVTFLALYSALGIRAAAVGLSASAVSLAVVFAIALVRRGWTPSLAGLGSPSGLVREAGRLTFASIFFVGTNLAYVACVALATRHRGGEATLFAYAYVGAAALVAVTANVSAMARSPAVVAGAERAQVAAATGVATLRLTLLLAGPVVGMALLVGRPVLELVLGSSYSGHDVHRLLITLLALTGWIVASAAGIFAIVELLARSELKLLARLALALVLATVACALLGGALAGIVGIAAGLSVAMIGVTAVQLRSAFAHEWRATALAMARAIVRELVVLACAFGPAGVLLLAIGASDASRTGCGILAAVVVTLASRVAWPGEFRALLALAHRHGQATERARPDRPETATV
jgi:ABC-type multidrug transport system fused ATPase/permease subunit